MLNAKDVVLGKTLREHIGGRWAISLIAYAINAPINLLSIFGNASASEGQQVSALWWVVAAAGYLVFGAIIWLASGTLFRNRRVNPVPIWWVVVLGLIAGGSRGLVVGLMAQELQLAPVDLSLVLTRVFTGAALGALLLPFAALILSVITTYRHERARLIDEQVESERVVLQSSGTSQALRSALLESVQGELANIRTSNQARELSHRIWEKDQSRDFTPPEVSWWRVVRTAVVRNPYASTPVIAVWGVSAIGTLTVTIGFFPALGQILFSAIAIAATFWVGRRLNRNTCLPGLVIFLGVMFATIALTSFIASWIFDPRDWPAGAGLAVTNALWIPSLTVGVGFVVTAIRSSESVIAELEAEVTEVELVRVATVKETEELRKLLAAELHGSVQSQLLISAALRDNPELAKVAQLSVGPIEFDAQALLDTPDVRPIDERLTAIVNQWRGLMQVEVEWVGDQLSIDKGDALTRVVEEGLSNAFRHGKASQVLIRISVHESGYSIEIQDNGQGIRHEESPGLGLRVIESLNPSSFELVTSPNSGCILKVEFRN